MRLALVVLACGARALVRSPGSRTRRSVGLRAEPDFVEKLFGAIFGKVEDAPYGLTRMSVETYPDQYPADTTGARAPAVDGDAEVPAQWVRPVMFQTALAGLPLMLAYDSDQQGWTPAAFHAAVDRRGPGVVLCESVDGQFFGGYNSKGWVGYGEARPGIANFLFAWAGDGETFVKLPKVGGAGMAVVDKPEQGPMFGSEGLCVPMLPNNPRRARCKLGPYYARMPLTDGNSMLRGGAPDCQLKSLVVFVADWGDKSIPFDDAIPFSLT